MSRVDMLPMDLVSTTTFPERVWRDPPAAVMRHPGYHSALASCWILANLINGNESSFEFACLL